MPDVAQHAIDSAIKFEAHHRGAAFVCGSHGGVYAAYLAAKAGVRAVTLCDAGIGKDRAGIGCLDYCQALGMASATVAHDSARIADADDMLRRGRISHANAIAAGLGVTPGQPVRAAAELLRAAAPAWSASPPAYAEARKVVLDEPGRPRVICVDSVSLALPEDAGQIVATGSHGALMGGRPEAALQVDALAALFNDAGIGIDEAGVQHLAALERRGIAAATVGAMTARIGDGLSTYADGVLSRVNARAKALGGEPGMRARAFVDMVLAGAGRA